MTHNHRDTTLSRITKFKKDLKDEWVEEYNGSADKYKEGSRNRAMWKCRDCGYKYFEMIIWRTKHDAKCINCSRDKQYIPVINDYNIHNWVVDPAFDNRITPFFIGQKIKLKCPKCDYTIEDYPSKFNYECPDCKV
ncbi:hypothetical protein E24_00241 [Faustovirus]|nr:hypothetical protein PRJ_Fausto_00226 [Faustovirus]AMN83169.1 hypothetical protein E24_00241 [Faustovirus]AMN84149.1 hypothetical protein D5a_00239 [Faustovirus]AMN85138.1 hypothetical protein E23_00240 [Faustovirus]QBR99134.1 putative zinc-ribbon domain containing protein [Faustovirus mariensis]